MGPFTPIGRPGIAAGSDTGPAPGRSAARDRAAEARRTARLLFSAELGDGTLGAAELAHPLVHAAAVARPVPSAPLRLRQRLRMKRGALTAREALGPALAARHAVLGPAAARAPRFLVRMDEYPHVGSLDDPDRYGDAAFSTWRDIMADAGCPHLIAVLPVTPSRSLDPDGTEGRELGPREAARLRQLADDGVAFAVHGYDHRTRDAHPRRHSELCGLSGPALGERLDRAEALLRERGGIAPRVFVPPFNRFDVGHYPLLAERYDVVCAGPETVRLMGYHPTPQWRGDAVYLPAYEPLYGTAGEILPLVRQLVDAAVGLWIPVVLHWGWEAARGWEDLRRLAEVMAPYAADWDAFLAAVDASREEPSQRPSAPAHASRSSVPVADDARVA